MTTLWFQMWNDFDFKCGYTVSETSKIQESKKNLDSVL